MGVGKINIKREIWMYMVDVLRQSKNRTKALGSV